MKKTILFLAGSLIAGASFAQATLEQAQDLVKANDLLGAKKAIDEVAPVGKDATGQAWFTKGYIYQRIADDSKLKSTNPTAINTALDAYKKFVATEKKIDLFLAKENVASLVTTMFNTGVNSYNDKKYAEANIMFDEVNNFKSSDIGTKLFSTDKFMDTLVAQSKLYKAYCLYNDKKTDDATALFEEAAKSGITKDVDVYIRLINIYQNANNGDKWLATIKSAIAAYPNNNELKSEEINYYLQHENQDELIKKLEEATVREPKSTELLFSLATAYNESVRSKKATDIGAARKKAITAFEKLSTLDAKKGEYPYNLAAIYFNQAVEINGEINKNKEDKAKVDAGKKEREDLLKKAMPFLEKAILLYETAGVKAQDEESYKTALRSLDKTYEILGMKEKRAAISKKL
jgi:hypothetical protein